MQFITGSQFNGSFNHALHSFDGMGNYIYPDGSEYRGTFKRGKFHGYGQIILSKPYRFTFVGVFENGKLKEMYEMFFGDGLRLKVTIKENQFKFANWKYCCEKDRRYSYEISGGLGPPGQSIFMKNLSANSYDIGGGIYKNDTGFIVKISPPFFSTRFLSCDKERDWIKRNCRRGPYDRDINGLSGIEPIPEIGKQIIHANFKATEILNDCSCNQRYDRKLLQKLSQHVETSWPDMPTSLSTSVSSFSDNTMEILDLSDKCRDVVRTLRLDLTDKNNGEIEEELIRPSHAHYEDDY